MTDPGIVNASQRLDRLTETHWASECDEWPMLAFLAGVASDEPLIAREAPSDHDRRDRRAGESLDEVEAIVTAFANEGSPPTRDQATTLALLRHELETTRRLHAVDAHLRPSLFPSSPAVTATQFAHSVAIHDDDSAALYVERLRALPRWLNDLEKCLSAGQDMGHRYPRRILSITAANVRATLSGPPEKQAWLGPFERARNSYPGLITRWLDRALDVVRDDVLPGFEAFAGYIEGPLSTTARESLGCRDSINGADLYGAHVYEKTTLDLDAEAIHELGRREAERINEQMADVVSATSYGADIEGFRKSLGGTDSLAPSGEQLRVEAESFAKRVDKLIPAYFGRIPRITYGIESMTDAMSELMPPAYAQPNPADGSRPGLFWLTSLPDRCPLYMLRPFTVHEAWPGHLMHIALMQEDTSLPEFRRHGSHRYHVMLEAWALYCERLGDEMGLYETPEQQFGRFESELWRALRLVVDTGIHWYGWSREQAIDTMTESLVLPRGVIAAEVDRYIGWPAQALIYQIGNIELRKLREQAQLELGEAFDLRGFHDAVLGAGPVTLPVLSSEIGSWLEAQSSTEAARDG